MVDFNNVTTTSLSLMPGMVATLSVDNIFINAGPMIHNGESRTLTNGFLSENELRNGHT